MKNEKFLRQINEYIVSTAPASVSALYVIFSDGSLSVEEFNQMILDACSSGKLLKAENLEAFAAEDRSVLSQMMIYPA